MMLLVIVAYCDLRAKPEFTAVRTEYSVDNLKYCCLAGSVASDKCNMFAALYVKIDIMEKSSAVKAFGKPCYGKNIIAALNLRAFSRLSARLMDFSRLNCLSLVITAS